MRYRVQLHPEAEAELREAHAWLKARSPAAAERWRRGLLRKAQTLTTFPERCPRAPEADKLGADVRQLLYGRGTGRYRLPFVIEGQTVIILHVRHGSRKALGEETP